MRRWCADERTMKRHMRARLLLGSLALATALVTGACSDDGGGTQTSGTSTDATTTTGPITGVRDRTQDAVDGLNSQQNQLEEDTGSGNPSY